MNVFINGKHIHTESGKTILQAARENGVRIPSLCDVPFLKSVGACRICLVEIEGNPKFLPACTTPVADDMVITTHSERINAARKGVVELMLIRHPLKCFSCSSNGKCELQDIAYELGVESTPFSPPPHLGGGGLGGEVPLDDNNPFFVRDLNKCVLCGRCIRVCHEKAQVHAIDFQNRGIDTLVAPARPLEDSDCVFCGQCVQVCPTGALYEKTAHGRGRAWELKNVKTTCSYCGVGCALEIQVNTKTKKIANVITNPGSATTPNKGRSCVKGRFAWQFVESPDRLSEPLVRDDNGLLQKASWSEAYEKIAYYFKKIKTEHGADAFGFLSSARCTNEENYLFQKLARQVVGTNNVAHCAHL